jgi:hypothetical protein
MTDQEAREFVEMLAVPEASEPPACPICGCGHPLETSCGALDRPPSRSGRAAGAAISRAPGRSGVGLIERRT